LAAMLDAEHPSIRRQHLSVEEECSTFMPEKVLTEPDMAFRLWNVGPKACLGFFPVVSALVVSVSVLDIKMVGVVTYLFFVQGFPGKGLGGNFCAHDFVGRAGAG